MYEEARQHGREPADRVGTRRRVARVPHRPDRARHTDDTRGDRAAGDEATAPARERRARARRGQRGRGRRIRRRHLAARRQRVVRRDPLAAEEVARGARRPGRDSRGTGALGGCRKSRRVVD